MESMILTVMGFVLSIGTVGVVVGKYAAKAAKLTRLAKEAIELTDDFTTALKPDADGKVTVTAEEVTQLNKDLIELKLAWAELKA